MDKKIDTCYFFKWSAHRCEGLRHFWRIVLLVGNSGKEISIMFAKLIERVPLLAALSRLSAGAPVKGSSAGAPPPSPVETGMVVLGWGNLPIAAPSDGKVSCHFCGDPISVGDGVTLYHPAVEDPQRPASFHVCKRGTRSIIGCIKTHCASGMERAGTLVPFDGTTVSADL
jgi:hypothetical protein